MLLKKNRTILHIQATLNALENWRTDSEPQYQVCVAPHTQGVDRNSGCESSNSSPGVPGA